MMAIGVCCLETSCGGCLRDAVEVAMVRNQ